MSVSAAPEQMCQPKSMNFVRKMYVGTRIPSVEPHGLARGFSQHIKIRGGRKNLLNEDPWGDHFKDVKIPRSWKDQTKQKRQYHSYKKQKRKKYGKE